VGRKTAEVLVVALDEAGRFQNARQVSAYLGLVPRQYQSGETDRNGRITKRGSRLVRTILRECAWASLKYNPDDCPAEKGGVAIAALLDR
jgi:transposase